VGEDDSFLQDQSRVSEPRLNCDRMRAGGIRRPVIFLALIAFAIVSGCYSSNSRKELRATVSLLHGLSDKLGDYCTKDFVIDSRKVSSEEMGEFYYGLQKARAFQQMSAGRMPRDVSDRFAALVDAYEKFVRDADEYRLNTNHSQQQLDSLMTEHAEVASKSREVIASLDASQ
jgi:hypothetical protein